MLPPSALLFLLSVLWLSASGLTPAAAASTVDRQDVRQLLTRLQSLLQDHVRSASDAALLDAAAMREETTDDGESTDEQGNTATETTDEAPSDDEQQQQQQQETDIADAPTSLNDLLDQAAPPPPPDDAIAAVAEEESTPSNIMLATVGIEEQTVISGVELMGYGRGLTDAKSLAMDALKYVTFNTPDMDEASAGLLALRDALLMSSTLLHKFLFRYTVYGVHYSAQCLHVQDAGECEAVKFAEFNGLVQATLDQIDDECDENVHMDDISVDVNTAWESAAIIYFDVTYSLEAMALLGTLIDQQVHDGPASVGMVQTQGLLSDTHQNAQLVPVLVQRLLAALECMVLHINNAVD